MASAVADLEAGLQAMQNLKPPGVSGSRIANLTSLCVANVQSESVLIQKIFTHFKKTPGTHKLGVLYVIDSVTRKWVETAKAQGQAISSFAADGTYAAGIHRVTELMPVLMNDIIQTAPNEQKEKIRKLLDIWEKGQTFPQPMIDSFRSKLTAPKETTTPPGSPPAALVASFQGKPANPPLPQQSAPAPAPAPTSGSSILEALANIARQNSSATPTRNGGAAPVPQSYGGIPTPGLPQPVASIQQPQQPPTSYGAPQQPSGMPSLPFSLPQMPGQTAAPIMPQGLGGPNPYAQAAPAAAPGAAAPGGLDPNTQQQIMLIKALADQGVPFEKIPALIQSMTGGGAQAPPNQPPNPYAQQPWAAQQPHADERRDRGYGNNGVGSPRGGYGGRSRSRSPDRGWGNRGSPQNGRGSFGRDSPARGRYDGDDFSNRRGYRERSPAERQDRLPSPGGEKWIEFDRNMPSGSIKVLSRTLFVGGVTCSEAELRRIFSRFGTVQTCIVNRDKRHAFVKMLTRDDAVSAKKHCEDTKNMEIQLRTRWGVGFGPRDCSDYSTGVSIIPIQRLTEADRKWMLTAPYGGSGGRPIEAGMVVEEPDIEIGAGVSSKAISRRMQTDKGGNNGPKSSRKTDEDHYPGGGGSGGGGGGGGRFRGGGREGRGDTGRRRDDFAPDNAQDNGTFPFGIGTLPNGMPNFPAGFAFPDPGPGR